eukprot:gene570-846_t
MTNRNTQNSNQNVKVVVNVGEGAASSKKPKRAAPKRRQDAEGADGDVPREEEQMAMPDREFNMTQAYGRPRPQAYPFPSQISIQNSSGNPIPQYFQAPYTNIEAAIKAHQDALSQQMEDLRTGMASQASDTQHLANIDRAIGRLADTYTSQMRQAISSPTSTPKFEAGSSSSSSDGPDQPGPGDLGVRPMSMSTMPQTTAAYPTPSRPNNDAGQSMMSGIYPARSTAQMSWMPDSNDEKPTVKDEVKTEGLPPPSSGDVEVQPTQQPSINTVPGSASASAAMPTIEELEKKLENAIQKLRRRTGSYNKYEEQLKVGKDLSKSQKRNYKKVSDDIVQLMDEVNELSSAIRTRDPPPSAVSSQERFTEFMNRTFGDAGASSSAAASGVGNVGNAPSYVPQMLLNPIYEEENVGSEQSSVGSVNIGPQQPPVYGPQLPPPAPPQPPPSQGSSASSQTGVRR